MKLLAALLVLLTAQLTHAQDSETWREYSPEPAPTAEPEPTPGPPPQWRRKWTRTDLLRVRAELAARRAELLRQAKRDGVPLHTAPRPRVYGNAGSPRMVGFEVLTLFQDDVGFRRFSRQDANQRFGVFASYDLLTLAPKLIAGVELGGGFEHNEARGLLGAPDTTDLYSQTFHAGIDLRWDVLNFLAPTLRAWGGVSLSSWIWAEPVATIRPRAPPRASGRSVLAFSCTRRPVRSRAAAAAFLRSASGSGSKAATRCARLSTSLCAPPKTRGEFA